MKRNGPGVLYDVPPSFRRDLDQWLEQAVNGDTRRKKVKAAMLKLIDTDPEYWWGQEFTNTFDHALGIE